MIPVNRKAIRNLLMIVVILLILASHFGPLIGITSMLALDQSGTLAVWFESFLYLLCAGLLALVAFERSQTSRADGWRWRLFALFMIFLSVNATAEINKKIVDKISIRMWGIPGSVFDLALFLLLAAALMLILWPVLSGMPPRYRRMMFLAGVVFGLGAIVVDDLGDILYRGSNEWFYLLEELLEFSGFVLLADTLIAYLADQSSTITLNFQDSIPKKPEGGV